MNRWSGGILTFICAAAWFAAPAWSEGKSALFLSKSSGFEHSCIKQENGAPSHVDKILTKLFPEKLNERILCTKDAGLINADNLKNYNLVIFITTGNLTESGEDGNPPMGPSGVTDLIQWIANGGGFMGYHCASDTFHSPPEGPPTPYIAMVGAEFKTHGQQFKGTVKVVDPSHPTMAAIPQDWTIRDEWYMFRNFNWTKIHVLALLDPGKERSRQEKYNVQSYPIIWCSTVGKGRVYFNAMGHREDVWDNPIFQQSVVDATKWVMGEGPAQAAPNFKQVVPGL